MNSRTPTSRKHALDAQQSGRSALHRWTLVAALMLASPGCQGRLDSHDSGLTDSGATTRDIRVLLGSSKGNLRAGIRGEYQVRNRAGAVLHRGTELPWAAITGERSVVLGNQALGDTWVEVVPAEGILIAVARRDGRDWSAPRYYEGILRLQTTADGGVQVINVLDLETYVAGVLPGELYPNFHRESFRAQAVAARTYALFQMSTASRPDYDVSDGEAAQVYEGVADTPAYRQACAAVEHTRGLVCTWTSPMGERIFCTFFSSACGGRTQNVTHCKAMQDIPPLSGGVVCDYCRIAKGEAYRWAPRTMKRDELIAKLAVRYPEAAGLGKLSDVTVPQREPGGRALKFAVVGSTGKRLELPAENFRLAIGSRVMRSTACDVRIEGDQVVFENGKGFGHGLGLCQWGMEGQAREGRTAAEILAFYYPQSHLTRAY